STDPRSSSRGHIPARHHHTQPVTAGGPGPLHFDTALVSRSRRSEHARDPRSFLRHRSIPRRRRSSQAAARLRGVAGGASSTRAAAVRSAHDEVAGVSRTPEDGRPRTAPGRPLLRADRQSRSHPPATLAAGDRARRRAPAKLETRRARAACPIAPRAYGCFADAFAPTKKAVHQTRIT